jgi:hypothetical protein
LKKIIQCRDCGFDFDLFSPEKRRAGGLANCCEQCSEETAIKYAGVQAADGKQSQATILKFNTEEDKKNYLSFWWNNSGMNKGKSGSQLSKSLSTTPGISFQTVVGFNPTNHKGKL